MQTARPVISDDHGAALAQAGYLLQPQVVHADLCTALRDCAPVIESRAGGARNILRDWPQAADVLHTLHALARRLLDPAAVPVRAILFDKTPQSNWAVPWHQDLSIALQARHEVAGYAGWSRKQGVWHAQPPREVLESMLTLRLHLDDCDAQNAPLQVLPGSHARGRVAQEEIAAQVAGGEAVTCTARVGDVLAMRPLLLHASAKAARAAHRRVLHVEYAACALPAPLRWHAA